MRPRTRAVPAVSAASFPIAGGRPIGAMPQLVHGKSRSAGTKQSARSMVAATSSGVSTRSLATSDRAEQDILSGEQAEQLDRHLGAGALD